MTWHWLIKHSGFPVLFFVWNGNGPLKGTQFDQKVSLDTASIALQGYHYDGRSLIIGPDFNDYEDEFEEIEETFDDDDDFSDEEVSEILGKPCGGS